MKKRVLCFTLFIFSLAGCGSEKDANERNFGAAISKYLQNIPQNTQVDDQYHMCFHMGLPPQHYIDINQSEIPKMQTLPESFLNGMEALAKVGLFTKGDVEEKYPVMTSKVRRYTLTDEGKKYYSDHTGNICYGKPVLDKVVKWSEVLKYGDSQVTFVTYRYKIENIPEWANDAAVKSAFPFLKNTVKENTIPIVLAKNGWEVQ